MGIADIARIHMVVLASLSIGLLMSISWFEKAWNDMERSRGESSSSSAAAATAGKEPEKTDWLDGIYCENDDERGGRGGDVLIIYYDSLPLC